MREIHVADQPILSLSRIIQITGDGIRYRLFRSSVTVAVIAVAVAFLTNILSAGLFSRAVGQDTRERIDQLNVVSEWVSRLTTTGSREELIASLAAAEESDPLIEESAALGTFDPTDVQALRRSAEKAQSYLGFFAGLDYGRRRNLVHTAEGVRIFTLLRTAVGWQRFADGLKAMKSVRFVGEVDDFAAFLSTWSALAEQLDRLLAGRAVAIGKIEDALGEQDVLNALASATADFGTTIREAGFVLPPAQAALIEEQARYLLDRTCVEESLQETQIRQLIARRYNVLAVDVDMGMVWSFLRNRKQAGQYAEVMRAISPSTAEMDAERLYGLAMHRREEDRLIRARKLTRGSGTGWLGLGERMAWLLMVSLLVCGIGITNAMLMTVTDRFREIATMKCLGALDGVIMAMFVLESSFLGLVGGVIGALLGCMIGLGRTLAAFGLSFAAAVPLGDILIGMGAAVLMGIALAALASLYPSFSAARLAPMEAMRIE